MQTLLNEYTHSEKTFPTGAQCAGLPENEPQADAASLLAEAIRTEVATCNDACSFLIGMAAPAPVCGALSAREVEVLQLAAQGHTTREIAARIGLSAKTVSVHRDHIRTKLNVHNGVELLRYALRQGLVQL